MLAIDPEEGARLEAEAQAKRAAEEAEAAEATAAEATAAAEEAEAAAKAEAEAERAGALAAVRGAGKLRRKGKRADASITDEIGGSGGALADGGERPISPVGEEVTEPHPAFGRPPPGSPMRMQELTALQQAYRAAALPRKQILQER